MNNVHGIYIKGENFLTISRYEHKLKLDQV